MYMPDTLDTKSKNKPTFVDKSLKIIINLFEIHFSK